MSTESEIKTALDTITEFKSVRYVVNDAGDDAMPQEIPFCVFTTGPKSFEGLQTFCGVDSNLYFQEFVVLIYAESTVKTQDLANQSILALTGLGVLRDVETTFEPDLRCYLTTISFS